MSEVHRIGVDENGLGARLGPLVVTGVLARTSERGARALSRPLPKRVRADLGDSKELVSHGNVELGEAWARVLVPKARTPAELLEHVSLEGTEKLQEPCPRAAAAQCWSSQHERFLAGRETVSRLGKHLAWWTERGVEILAVRSSIVCTKLLNDGRDAGRNRFVMDLHAMEHLVLGLRGVAGREVLAVCGKVGGMDDYSKFFGPLSQTLHAVLAREKARSAYRFPGVGEVRFVRDADASDPLVMLASVVGKYLRELLMTRVSAFYGTAGEDSEAASGYHDPVTARFVLATELLRKRRKVPDGCFERYRDGA